MQLYQPTITGSLSVSGSVNIDGSLTINGSLSGTSSNASNSTLLNGSGSGEFVPTGSFNTFSSSVLTYTGSANSRLSSLETTSGSNITRIAALETASGSAITRLSSLEAKTGSYATTGSNVFVDGQYLSSSFNPTGFSTTASLYTDGGLRVTKDAYISGTLYLNNVTVYGTQSVAYITSSQLNISTNLISVNTDTPSVRFGGLSVYDSGSTGLTGSILWDSENNRWIYSNPSGSTYDGGMFISGPRNSSGLGSEVGTTACMLLVGQGGDHLTSSMIYHSSAVTCVGGALLSSGCIGIGSTSPEFALDVNGDIALLRTQKLQFTGSTSGDRNRAFIGGTPNNDLFFAVAAGACTLKLAYTGESCFAGTTCVPNFYANGCINVISGNSVNLTSQVGTANGLFGQINAGYGVGGVQNAASIEFQRSSLSWGDNGDIVFKTNPGGGTNTERMRLSSGGYVGIGTNSPIASLQICAPDGQLRLSGDGRAQMILSTSAKAWQFETSCGTGNVPAGGIGLVEAGSGTRFQISAGGVTCFSAAVCAQQFIGISSMTVNGPMYYQNGGNTYFQQYVGASCDFVVYNTTNNSYSIYTNSAQRFLVTGGGAIGINCSSPSATLHLNGCLKQSSANFGIAQFSQTFTAGTPSCFGYGYYNQGINDNVGGLIIVTINEASSNVSYNNAVWVGLVVNPRGGNTYVAGLYSFYSSCASSNISYLNVVNGAGNYFVVQACSASGAVTLRANVNFIGGGGVS